MASNVAVIEVDDVGVRGVPGAPGSNAGYITPRQFGAAGDGIVDDNAAWLITETAGTVVFLSDNDNYKIGPDLPQMVLGPGRLTYTNASANTATVGGFQIAFDPIQANIICTPEIWAEKAIGRTSSPGTGVAHYFNTFISAGSVLGDKTKTITRSTALGHAIGEDVIEWERVEAIGNGAMRFAERVQRSVAVGTLALQWSGASSRDKLIANYHDFFTQSVMPGQPGWDFGGLETANPGIGQRIWDFADYATSISQNSQHVALGRDALLHHVRGFGCTATGYQSAAHAFYSEFISAYGYMAFRDAVFTFNSAAFGNEAAAAWQEGDRNLIMGPTAAINWVKGSNNTIIGPYAGRAVLEGTSNVVIGYQAGEGYGSTVMNNTFAVQVGVANPCLLSGKLGAEDVQKLGVNLNPNEIVASLLHIRAGRSAALVAPSSSSGHVVIEHSAVAGLTFLTPAVNGSGVWFNDGSTASPKGGMFYSHTTSRMNIRTNGVTAITFGVGFLQVPSLPTSATGLASGQIWNDVANGNVLKVAA